MATSPSSSTSTSSGMSRSAMPSAGLSALDWIALVLMIIGAINWGLIGIAGFDLVAAIFGPMSTVSRIVYCLVGLAGLYGIVMAIRLGNRKTVVTM